MQSTNSTIDIITNEHSNFLSKKLLKLVNSYVNNSMNESEKELLKIKIQNLLNKLSNNISPELENIIDQQIEKWGKMLANKFPVKFSKIQNYIMMIEIFLSFKK